MEKTRFNDSEGKQKPGKQNKTRTTAKDGSERCTRNEERRVMEKYVP